MVTHDWIDVIDSAVKVGLGALAGGGFAVTVERLRQRNEERRRAEELRWALLVQPIIAFVDDLMAAVGEVYWSHIDHKEPRLEEKMMFFRERQGAVEARISALHDEELMKLWQPFTNKVVIVRMRINEPRYEGKDAYEEMQEGFSLGGQILRRLFDSRPK
jgi:alkanesulfonate monooxygenase SsuD/methylene tetrahydromethanopterin reductase-like flavin-dependent oxidoreductase (luciferase family)